MDHHVEEAEHFSVNAIVSLTNVLFFVVVQTLFFWFIASREVDRVVTKKAHNLQLLREQLREQGLTPLVRSLDALVLSSAPQQQREAEERRAERQRGNLRHTLMWMVPIAGVVVLAIAGLVVYNRRHGHSFGVAQRFGLFLVLFVYVFEILFCTGCKRLPAAGVRGRRPSLCRGGVRHGGRSPAVAPAARPLAPDGGGMMRREKNGEGL